MARKSTLAAWATSRRESVNTALKNADDNFIELYALVVGGADSGIDKQIADLEAAVGDSESGLVKDVADLQAAVGDAESGLVEDVADLQTAVGDESAGLVKDVADIQARLPLDTGNDKTVGSAALVDGTVAVTTSKAVDGALVLLSRKVVGGTTGDLSYVAAAGTLTINSASNLDTSTVVWQIIQ